MLAVVNKQKSQNLVEAQILQLRSDFSTWLVKKQMFETLCVFAQVQIIVSDNMDSLAAIANEDNAYLFLKHEFIENYVSSSDAYLFILMHELRHLNQVRSYRDWKYLVSFYPLQKALKEYLPMNLEKKLRLDELDSDFELKHEIFNLAADAAIHEDIVELFEPGILDRVSECMSRFKRDCEVKVSPVTVGSLERLAGLKLESKRDWLYYAQKLIEGLTNKIVKDPSLAAMLVDRNILGILQKSLDEHKFDLDAMDQLDLMFERAKGESRTLVESNSQNSSLSANINDTASQSELYIARKELSEQVRRIITMVKQTIVKAYREKVTEARSYVMPHRFLKEAPGRIQRVKKGKKSLSVIVLDTSGSMWKPIFLEHMVSAVYQLKSRNMLERAYCCDVEIYPLEVRNSRRMYLRGAGGTEWSVEHNTRVLKDLNTTQTVNIYYLTDEMVSGLEQAKQDERVNLTVINIPNLMTLFTKAKL